jgi:hypothetical protein
MFLFLLILLPAKPAHPVVVGPEFPIANTAGGEMALSPAFDGTNYLVGIIQDDHNITAQLVSPTGIRVGPRISTGRTGGLPFVAFDGTNYLMVWSDDATFPNDDIYGQFISPSGNLVGSPLAISTAPGKQDLDFGSGNVAFDGVGNYLVIWTDYRVATSPWSNKYIYGQIVSKNGTLVGGEIQISSTPGQYPAVAFDGTSFLVIWTQNTYDTDVYGQFISPSGTLAGSNFLIDGNGLLSNWPGIIFFDGTRYLVTIRDQISAYFTDDIGSYLRIVEKDGTVQSTRVTLYEGKTLLGAYVTAFDGLIYLAVVTQGLPPTTAKGMFYNTDLAPVSTWFTLFPTLGNKVPVAPVVLFDGNKYFALTTRGVYHYDPILEEDYITDGDVYGLFINPIATSLVIDLVGQDGLKVTLRATLKDGQGNPLQGKTVYFYEGTTSKASGPTLADGTLTKTITSAIGNHSFVARFKGDTAYAASNSLPQDVVIDKVILSSPANGAIVTTGTPTLSWEPYTDATLYHVQVSTSSTFGTGTQELTTTETSISSPVLTAGKLYYWRVYADILTGKTVFSDAWKVTFKSGTNVAITSMTQNGLKVTLSATFTDEGGNPIPGKTVAFYEGTTSKASGPTLADGTLTKTITSTIGNHSFVAKFKGDTTYAPFTSNPQDVIIGKVILTSPIDGAIVTTGTPTLSWEPYTDTTLYHIQVSTSSSFGTGTQEVTTAETSISSPPLIPGKLHYWRVYADILTGKTVPSSSRKLSFKSPVNLVFERLSWNGTQQTFKATLTQAETGTPIGGKTITFYESSDGGATYVSKGTATTGSLTSANPGIAFKTWTTTAGDHQAYASFKGDTSYAPQVTDPAAVIYISYPPVVFVSPVLPSICKGVPYYASVSSATNPSGGNGGPYHFELGTMGGFPPMGIILSPDGILSGTPTGTTSKFTICAVDTAGNSSCTPTSITVRTDCNPALTGTWVGRYILDFYTILCDGGYVGFEEGSATVYLQQVGTTVTGTISTQFDNWYCIADPTNRTGHLKGTTLGSNGIDFEEIEISGFVFPSYFIYTNDFDIYVWNGTVDFRLTVTKQ